MSSINIPASTIIKNQVYNFHSEKDGTDAKLTVSKKETEELVYSVAIEYLGNATGRLAWSFSFKKDDLPTRTFKLWNTQTISFKVADNNCIRIHEIDDKSENIYYADLTAPEYLAPLYLPLGIRQLIGLAKQMIKDKESEIYFHDSIVIIAENSSESLLIAEPDDTEFVKCALEEIPAKDGDSYDLAFTTTFKEKKCIFGAYAPRHNSIDDFRNEILEWEGVQLKSIDS